MFHPYGWSTPEQHVDLIDYAVKKYGKKVKFLTFREAQERLDRNVLGGHPLRDPKTGADQGVVLTDLNGDGFMDVIVENDKFWLLRTWVPTKTGGSWQVTDPAAPRLPLFPGGAHDLNQLPRIRLGAGSAFVTIDKEHAVFVKEKRAFVKAKFTLPSGARISDGISDFGLRFVDLDEDGNDDVIFSNGEEFGIYLFKDMESGWSRKVMAGKAGDKDALPPIALKGKNNGFFVHGRALYWQNENTSALKDLVDRRSFNDLLVSVDPQAKSPEASLSCLHPRPGFKAELMVSEPQVQSPIAIARGVRMANSWVVEMGALSAWRRWQGQAGRSRQGSRIQQG